MHTVVETPTYLKAAEKARMADEERENAVLAVARIPRPATSLWVVAGRASYGSLGAARANLAAIVVTYYMTEDEPVFLISVINKSKQADLSDAQKAEVKDVAKEIRDAR